MTPRKGVGVRKSWHPSFSHSLDSIEPASAKRSILVQKSYGSCFLDASHHTISRILRFRDWYMVQGSHWVSPWVQIWILHSDKCMIWHQNYSNRTSLWDFIAECKITVYSMAAIMKIGRHLDFFFGQMVFWKEQCLRSMCANFGACIRKWTIHL